MKIYKIKDRKKFNNAIWKLSNKVGSKCLAEKIGGMSILYKSLVKWE